MEHVVWSLASNKCDNYVKDSTENVLTWDFNDGPSCCSASFCWKDISKKKVYIYRGGPGG